MVAGACRATGPGERLATGHFGTAKVLLKGRMPWHSSASWPIGNRRLNNGSPGGIVLMATPLLMDRSRRRLTHDDSLMFTNCRPSLEKKP